MTLSVLQDEYAARRARALDQTSATQVQEYETCARLWFWNRIAGFREPPAPHLLRGTHIDERVQRFLTTGQVGGVEPVEIGGKTEEWSGLIAALAPFLPPVRSDLQLMVQERIALPTFVDGPTWVGFVDLAYWINFDARARELQDLAAQNVVGAGEVLADYLEDIGAVLQVDDLKSTSDFRYCKTPAELRANTQMMSYARWGYEEMRAPRVSIAHVYGRTRGAKKAHRVPLPGEPLILVERDEVAQFWDQKIENVREMVTIARAAASALDLPPALDQCDNMFGKPCPHRDTRCNIQQRPITIASVLDRARKDHPMPTLREKLAAATGGTPQAETPPPAPSAPPSGGGMSLREKLALKNASAAPDTGRMSSASNPSNAPKAAEPEPFGFCSACGTPLTPANASQLQDGSIKHIGCAKKAAETFVPAGDNVLPPETRNNRTTTPEEITALENAPKRGRKSKEKTEDKHPLANVTIECGTCGAKVPGAEKEAHDAAHVKARSIVEATTKAISDAENEIAKTLQEPADPLDRLLSLGWNEKQVEILIERDAVAAALAGTIKPPKDEEAPKTSAANSMRQGKASDATRIHDEEPAHASLPPLGGRGADEDGDTFGPAAELAALLAKKNEQVKRPKFPLVLFVDCVPDVSGYGQITPLDVWLAPIMELAARANVDKNGREEPVADLGLVAYTSRAMAAVAIRAAIESCPSALLIDSRSRWADVALEVLTPHCAMRVRGLR